MAGVEGGRVLLPLPWHGRAGARGAGPRQDRRSEGAAGLGGRQDSQEPFGEGAGAIGYDSAGRLQYHYHDKYRERKEREKCERILNFADRLPRMRRVTSGHLKHERLDREKVLACMTRMMNAAYFGVGDERYAKNNTYGIATLRRKLLRIEGDTVIFEYTGM